jgi:hypothetical protein
VVLQRFESYFLIFVDHVRNLLINIDTGHVCRLLQVQLLLGFPIGLDRGGVFLPIRANVKIALDHSFLSENFSNSGRFLFASRHLVRLGSLVRLANDNISWENATVIHALRNLKSLWVTSERALKVGIIVLHRLRAQLLKHQESRVGFGMITEPQFLLDPLLLLLLGVFLALVLAGMVQSAPLVSHAQIG